MRRFLGGTPAKQVSEKRFAKEIKGEIGMHKITTKQTKISRSQPNVGKFLTGDS
jgi:hypothetical protein